MFWWLMIAISMLVFFAMIFEQLFFWFMMASLVVMLAGAAIEIFCSWRKERDLIREEEKRKIDKPRDVAALIAATNGTDRWKR